MFISNAILPEVCCRPTDSRSLPPGCCPHARAGYRAGCPCTVFFSKVKTETKLLTQTKLASAISCPASDIQVTEGTPCCSDGAAHAALRVGRRGPDERRPKCWHACRYSKLCCRMCLAALAGMHAAPVPLQAAATRSLRVCCSTSGQVQPKSRNHFAGPRQSWRRQRHSYSMCYMPGDSAAARNALGFMAIQEVLPRLCQDTENASTLSELG